MQDPRGITAVKEVEWKEKWPKDWQKLVEYYQGLMLRLEEVRQTLGQMQQGGGGIPGYAVSAGKESMGTLLMEMQWMQQELTDLEYVKPALRSWRPGGMEQELRTIKQDVASGRIDATEGNKRWDALIEMASPSGVSPSTAFAELPPEETSTITTFLTPYETMLGVEPGGLSETQEGYIMAQLMGMPTPAQEEQQAWGRSQAELQNRQAMGQYRLDRTRGQRETQWSQNFQQTQFNAQQAQQAWANQFKQQQLAAQMGSNIGSRQAQMWAQGMPRALPPGTQHGIGYGPGGIVSQMFPGQQIPQAMPMGMPSPTAPYNWAAQFMQQQGIR